MLPGPSILDVMASYIKIMDYSDLPQELLFNMALYGQVPPSLSSDYIAHEMFLINPSFQWCSVFIRLTRYEACMNELSRTSELNDSPRGDHSYIIGGRSPQRVCNRSLPVLYPDIFPDIPSDPEIIDAIGDMNPGVNFGSIFQNERLLMPITRRLNELMIRDPSDPFTSRIVRGIMSGEIEYVNATEFLILISYTEAITPGDTDDARVSFPMADIREVGRSLRVEFPGQLILLPSGGWEHIPMEQGVRECQKYSSINELIAMLPQDYSLLI
jgi:hypothetical protein